MPIYQQLSVGNAIGTVASGDNRPARRALNLARFNGQWDGGPIASPMPTITFNSGATSAITSAYNYAAMVSSAPSTHFTYWGGNPAAAGGSYPLDGMLKANSLQVANSSVRMLYECWHYGRYFEWITFGQGGQNAVFINGRPTALLSASQSPSLLSPNDGAFKRITMDFGSVGYRRMGLQTRNAFGGCNVGPTDTVHPTGKNGVPRLIVIGDSFVEGTGTDEAKGLAQVLGNALGCDTWVSGSGGTGYLATNGARGTFRSRIVVDCLNYSPDMIIIAGGINDSSANATALQTEAQTLYDQIIAALPNCRLVIVSPFWPSGVTAAITTAAAAIKAAAVSRGLTYVDMLNPLLLRGTGYVGATTGSGNADLITGSDSTHPTDLGHQILAARIYEELIGVL